jgi:hypothetical protein
MLTVAVGMSVTRHPPHRSRRAALPHRAPASGRDAQASAEAGRTPSSPCDRASPALRPAPGRRDHGPLGPLPALHRRRRSPGATLVRRLPRDAAAVRLPAPVPHGRFPWAPPGGPGSPTPGQRPGLPGAAPPVAVPARGLRPRPGRRPRTSTAPPVWPAAGAERVGPQEEPACGALHTLPARAPGNAARLP